MKIVTAYDLADALIDEGRKDDARIVGMAAGQAEDRGKIIERLASVCRTPQRAKREAMLSAILREFPDEDALGWARLLSSTGAS